MTLAALGVLEEINIAADLAKQLKDQRFIIPLRLEPYNKVFGIAGLQYIDFVRGWADGLEKLFGALKRQKFHAMQRMPPSARIGKYTGDAAQSLLRVSRSA